MFLGQCRIVWECPSCGNIHGGVVEGGLIRLCQWCPHKGMCDVKEHHLTVKAEKLCDSYDCVLAQVLKGLGKANI